MENQQKTHPYSLQTIAAGLAICVFFLTIWATAHSLIIDRQSEDDIHFFYLTGVKIADAERHHELYQKVSHFLNENADRAYDPFRFDEREKVSGTYPLSSHIIVLVRSFFQSEFTGGEDSYIQAVVSILNITLHSTLTLSLLIFGVALFFVRRDFLVGAALGLTVALLIDWFLPWKYPLWILHVGLSSLSDVFERIIQTINLVFTASGISLFFPRGNFILFTFPVFLLRWSGRYGLAYILLALASTIHLSMGALLTLCLLSTDYLLRRDLIRSSGILAIVSGIIGWFLSGIMLKGSAIIPSFLPTWVTTIVLATVFFAAIRHLPVYKLLSPVEPLMMRIRGFGPIVSDFIIIYALWALLLPVAVGMYFYIGEPWNLWTWGELPGRYLMIMRGPLIIGLVILLLNLLRRQGVNFEKAAAFMALFFACFLLNHSLNRPNVYETTPTALNKGLQARSQTAIRAGQGERFEYVEADVYFSMTRAIDLNKPFPEGLLTFTAGACKRRQSSCQP